ncbi:MFS transporter [Rhodocytophaga aerolata]|uniref:MFS transporter n=1 Tax=Rhodocytophaga aerolata TaxID=455078 RepID=A0ABT8RB53_9BACT|nr:MFS transporter [Rhodocytophaga aerolata]MDO1449224.1 MFS transporter [Rhodocytophaga aerolata]
MPTVAQKTQNIQYDKRWTALFLLCTAQFMVIMDTSIIGVALPAIKEALGYSQANLQWIFNAYVIFFGGLLLLGGRLSDLFGARKIFSAGFLILTVASLLAGLAWSEASMNTGRALQGFGSALIAPAALTLVMSMFTDPKELGKALGFWGASAAAGGSAGVFLGGVITEWLSWRWVFLVNIPVGILVLVFIPTLLLAGKKKQGKIDIIGALSVTLALVMAVYAIVTADQAGWASLQTLGLLGGATAFFITFILIQRSTKEPLMPLHIFKAPNLPAANIVMALLAAAWIPLWFFLNLYLQQVLQFSAFNSGLALLPMTIAIMILMVGFTGQLVGKFGFKANLIAGLLILTLSLILFAQVPVNGSFVGNVLVASLLAALGMSLSYIPGTIASMSGAKPEETGLASGLVNTSYQVGSALGLAAMVALASSKTSSLLQAGSGQIEALNSGFHAAFVGAALIAGIATVIALVFIKSK